jgi:predicted glycosyltransferase involved in capsule biosynthesis
MTKRLSLVVSVLESYDVVRRQLLHFNHILTPDSELILVDDGSEPSLDGVCRGVLKAYDFTYYATNDRRPWTQPRGRNLGAQLARAERLLFFDIDHIVTRDIVERSLAYPGDKLHWVRRPGILDDEGHVITDPAVLLEYGLRDDRPSVHANSFLIRRDIFQVLRGYDESFCGRYGGDDIDFNRRYQALCREGRARPEEVFGEGFVYPDPARDVKKVFHSLRFE